MAILPTLLTLLALAVATLAVALSIRAIHRWRRRVEGRSNPEERAEKEEKDRQRALFVSKNLRTRVWGSGASTIRPSNDLEGSNDNHSSHSDPRGIDVDISMTNDTVSVPLGSALPPPPLPGREDESTSSLPSPSVLPTTTPSSNAAAAAFHAAAAAAAARLGREAARNSSRPHDKNHPNGVSSRADPDDDSDDDEDDEKEEDDDDDDSIHFMDSSVVTASSSDRGTATDGEVEQASSAQQSSSTDSRRARCAICSGSYRDGRDVVCESNNPSCPHVFHATCMRRWLLLNPNCPLCRHQYLLSFAAKWRAGLTTPATTTKPAAPPASTTTATATSNSVRSTTSTTTLRAATTGPTLGMEVLPLPTPPRPNAGTMRALPLPSTTEFEP